MSATGEPVAADGLAELVAVSRRLGADPDLVLHGGGNTSLKTVARDHLGREVAVLLVKGSGWDLATIEAPGFSPLRLDEVRALAGLERLSDSEMLDALRLARLDPSAPDPSVESILHALLPAPAVLHSHADVILALTNTPDGEAICRRVFGHRVVILPYVMPGFDLARQCSRALPEALTPASEGLLLLQHGLFTFGATMEEAYARHLALVGLALAELERLPGGWPTLALERSGADPTDALAQAELRQVVSTAAGRPMILGRHQAPDVAAFVARPDLATISQQGPATPDHVIRTKRLPQLGRDVAGYATAYETYVDGQREGARAGLTRIDPAPRIVLDAELGLLAAGRTAREADVAAEIYRHTMRIAIAAAELGGYRALPEGDVFAVEYWDLEQAKLRRAPDPPPFAGQVALITGAASGIGRACAAALRERGAAVVGLDLDPSVGSAFDGPDWLGLTVDVTDAQDVRAALARAVERFGGLDICVPAAGIFGRSAPLAELDVAAWRRTQAVNVDAVASLLALAHPFLRRAPTGGRVVIIGSRNALAPGRSAAAYSASKAAVTQLARVAALEWAPDGIRVNVVHPDGVFDTALWTPGLLAERAARYGLSVEAYRRRNLLGVEVTSADVAGIVAELCGPRFRAVTGAQLPIDGGNERVI
ncbi:MAG TPA: bifunctional aldolase/short-chain dehydrogenase [Candidatus Limnocylindrales bacterium]|nr:bifunctional aldolase/short-chain dehydrogenase [Candidatus Limnocylindrales bacterium]